MMYLSSTVGTLFFLEKEEEEEDSSLEAEGDDGPLDLSLFFPNSGISSLAE